VARFDKYEPHVGGYRARLAANWLTNDVGVLVAVGLDANGRVVKTTPAGGYTGVVALGKAKQAGDQIDVMTSGEIVDCAGLVAGTKYYISATGVISATPPVVGTNALYLGNTVEADRLVVRVAPYQGGA
jgi:hypothetical protein